VDEFEIIRRFFLKENHSSSVCVGIGDDGAVVQPSPNHNLVISTDTLIEGVHYPLHSVVADIGYRAVAVNLSDMAAMGAKPRWMTLSLSLSEINERWLEEFSNGLHVAANEYSVTLVGGDTTRGAQQIVTIQMIGETKPKEEISRANANKGDLIFVTGTLGDAAAGLKQFSQSKEPDNQCAYLVQRFFRPTARIEVGRALVGVASAAIDISDGMYADAKKILDASSLGGTLNFDKIPLSKAICEFYNQKQARDFALNGGDDYELLFTASPSKLTLIRDISKQYKLRITQVGKVHNQAGLQCTENNSPIDYHDQGYLHFK